MHACKGVVVYNFEITATQNMQKYEIYSTDKKKTCGIV